MRSDAYINVCCARAGCTTETDIELPFVYGGIMHTDGRYDHSDDAVDKRLKREGWVIRDGLDFCCTDCADWEAESG